MVAWGGSGHAYMPTVTWGGSGCLANSHRGHNFHGSEPGITDVVSEESCYGDHHGHHSQLIHNTVTDIQT